MRSARSGYRTGPKSFRIPMRGYERPIAAMLGGSVRFRIPMRGYEASQDGHGVRIAIVPNPHEGL